MPMPISVMFDRFRAQGAFRPLRQAGLGMSGHASSQGCSPEYVALSGVGDSWVVDQVCGCVLPPSNHVPPFVLECASFEVHPPSEPSQRLPLSFPTEYNEFRPERKEA